MLAAFSGGLGTLDELCSTLTLVQTGKTRPVSIVLFGSAYWRRLLDMDLLVEKDAIAPEDMRLVIYVDTPLAAWDTIAQQYAFESV